LRLSTAMLWRWIIAFLLVFTVCSSVSVGTARAQSIGVTVGQSSLTLDMNLVLQENLTALPVFNIVVNPSNTSSVYSEAVGPINDAIKSLVPTASVSSLTLRAETLNSTKTWLLEENYSVVVTGANTIRGSTVSADLSFISMSLPQPIMIAGQELNAVGPDILLQPLKTISSQYSKLGYFINGHQTLSAVIPEQTTATFWLLNFTWVPAVSTWTSQTDLLGQSTTWTYSQPDFPYNLTLGVPSPEGTLLKSFIALFIPSLNVTLPYNAQINGNTISFHVPASSELVMPVVAGTSLVVLVAATLFDRRITGRLQTRRKKR
jgi:hypothetical protein